VRISSGDAYSARSGDIVLNSGRAALSRGPGVSGKVSLGTSAMTNGDSGDIELLTGDSMSGTSGNVTIATVRGMLLYSLSVSEEIRSSPLLDFAVINLNLEISTRA
jgi:hypothetical protein